ncbi:hypothetical protein Tco_1224960, partial [Tanacetum coccineum]
MYSKVVGKRKQVASASSDVDSDPDIHEFPSTKELKDSADCHWVVAHVTPPLWKQHLKEISLDKLCDIHDKAYMRQVVLDNVMNRRTRELMSTLSEAKTACDAIQEREREKDKAYAELEAKCNDALQDLDKNPLVLDLRAEIETLLKSSETRLLQEIDGLKQDRVVVVAKAVPHVAMELVCSDKMGLFVARLVKIALVYCRCSAFEEVAALKETFELEKMPGYRPFSKKEFDQASDNVATASYPFFTKATVDPYAPLEVLLP